ncbi:uncharacterized protein [Anabrus simplex]|uniref:uncharacterized protein n=1 Tax=Anabrus simplex TaxID=316456 RepID=UPI0035A29D99
MYIPLVLLLLVSDIRLHATPVQEKYDQRQTGEVNVQLDLRNIEVLAILGDYEMYEDYEDYPEVHVPPDVSGSSPTTERENVTISVGVQQNGTSSTTSSPPGEPNTPSSKRRCSEGFFRDRRGRCRKEKPALNFPFGLRLAPRVRPTE